MTIFVERRYDGWLPVANVSSGSGTLLNKTALHSDFLAKYAVAFFSISLSSSVRRTLAPKLDKLPLSIKKLLLTLVI